MTAPAVSPVLPTVVGAGFLAGHLAGRMGGRRAGSLETALTESPDALSPDTATVLVAELDSVTDYQNSIVECVRTCRPLLFVGTWRSLIYVGPLWRPGTAGCPHCLVFRAANSGFGPSLKGERFAESSSRDLTTFTLGPGVLRMVEHYTKAALSGRMPGSGTVLLLDGSAGTANCQTLLPDSTCSHCGTLTTDTVPAFTRPDVPLIKPAPSILRTAELDLAVVEKDYLFAGLGLFKEVRQDLQSPYGACSVEVSTRGGHREPAFGRAGTFRTSRAIAVLEGLERYAGLYRGGKTAPVRASYAEVADQALHPPELGSHPEESYRTEGFHFQEFSRDTVVDWVWAYSFRRQDLLLIPERAAFWGPRHDGETSFAHDTSNGCALGNSMEEVVLHGLREVAERDSFLLTWYRKLALPELRIDGVDPRLDQLLAKSRLFTGFRFRCFDSTMEYGMPSFWLVAENTRDEGPCVIAGAGAHPDPVQAICGGLYELVGTVLATLHDYEQRRPDGLRMLEDPAMVRQMADHSLLGALPEARERYSFLLDTEHETYGLADLPTMWRASEPDLRADLDTALAAVLSQGLDVLVVDHTMPELHRNGLRCGRVLVPGLVPMTFGHINRRTRHLPRLTEGTGLPYPSLLGRDDDLGGIPHPFP